MKASSCKVARVLACAIAGVTVGATLLTQAHASTPQDAAGLDKAAAQLEAKGNAQPTVRVGSRPAEVIAAKITISNLRKSYDFYTKILGLQAVRFAGLPAAVFDDPEVNFTEVLLNFSGSPADPTMCLIKQRGLLPAPDSAKLTWLGFKTPDVRAIVDRAKAAGYTVESDAQAVLGMEVAVIRDPDNYRVELVKAQSVAK